MGEGRGVGGEGGRRVGGEGGGRRGSLRTKVVQKRNITKSLLPSQRSKKTK